MVTLIGRPVMVENRPAAVLSDIRPYQSCWSRTQSSVALSSCETELYALVEAAREAMFLSSIVCGIEDARSDQTFELMLDASSTMALMKREGLGKLKHVEIRYFFLQDLIKSNRCKITKVRSQNNPVDLMTKHLDRQTLTTQ